MAENTYLKRAYQLCDQFQTKQLYSEWAESYDETMADFDYQTPRRCVEALQRHCTSPLVRILDVGCGSGISGQALYDGGFSVIDGSDISAEMLDLAANRPAVYQSLQLVSLDNPFDFEKGAYDVITAMGVIADKHAPPAAIAELLSKLEAGGLLIFSLNNHTLENPAYLQACSELCAQGLAEIAEQEEGPHITALKMTSKVMVMKKL